MELLIAMFFGAVGAVSSLSVLRRRKGGVWVPTFLGMFGGYGAWQVLALIGPGEKAGPLVLWHLGMGAVFGGVLALLAASLWARFVS